MRNIACAAVEGKRVLWKDLTCVLRRLARVCWVAREAGIGAGVKIQEIRLPESHRNRDTGAAISSTFVQPCYSAVTLSSDLDCDRETESFPSSVSNEVDGRGKAGPVEESDLRPSSTGQGSWVAPEAGIGTGVKIQEIRLPESHRTV
ncbi:hypothetical protein MRX96_005192 [Rhipicephalus microplus]